MKKSTSSRVFIALFLALCLAPSLGILVLGPSTGGYNEILSPAPALKGEDGGLNPQVLSESADWLGDHFALRQELTLCWARLNAALFHTSVNDQVVLGSGGWLYYAPTLDDYRGASLDGETLDAIVDNLRALQGYVEERGGRFLFVTVPNKNSLYPEHMPERLPGRHETAPYGQLLPRLRAAGVPTVDLAALLGAAGETLYYRTDSHWTAKGAALAADGILRALGRDSDCSAHAFAPGAPRAGDLYRMLYPGARGEEPELLDTAPHGHVCLADPRQGDAIRIETRCESGEGTLFCWRDSFGAALYPYLADSFGEAAFSRSAVYDPEKLAIGENSVVILEIVERDIPKLADSSRFPME